MKKHFAFSDPTMLHNLKCNARKRQFVNRPINNFPKHFSWCQADEGWRNSFL